MCWEDILFNATPPRRRGGTLLTRTEMDGAPFCFFLLLLCPSWDVHVSILHSFSQTYTHKKCCGVWCQGTRSFSQDLEDGSPERPQKLNACVSDTLRLLQTLISSSHLVLSRALFLKLHFICAWTHSFTLLSDSFSDALDTWLYLYLFLPSASCWATTRGTSISQTRLISPRLAGSFSFYFTDGPLGSEAPH